MAQVNVSNESVLSGSFKRGGFINLLNNLGSKHLSGSLHISSKDGDGFIVFYKGYIVVVFSHGMYSTLRDDLSKKGILSDDEIKEILELQKQEPKDISELQLIKSGRVTKEFLYQTINENSLKVLRSMLYWDGIYRFYEEDIFNVPDELIIDIKSIQRRDKIHVKGVSDEYLESKIHGSLFTTVLDLTDEIDNISDIREAFNNVSRRINSFKPKEIILIVEEDPIMSTFLSDGLIRFNFEVEAHRSNKDAFKRIMELEAEKIPVVVVMDLMMENTRIEKQGDSEMDFLQKVSINYPNIPVVIISSITDPKVKMKCLFTGASYFMIKPDVKFSEKNASDPNLDHFIEEMTYYIWNVIRMRKNFFEKEEVALAEEEIVNYLVADEKFSSGNEKRVLDTDILIVDDEPEIRTAIKDYLVQEGFLKIDTAENGEEAIKKFEKKRHAVVVVDIVMPKKNGIDVLRDIRAKSMSSQVIIITGNADKDSAVAAVRLGAFDYIEKPFDYSLISKVIKRALEKNLLLERLD